MLRFELNELYAKFHTDIVNYIDFLDILFCFIQLHFCLANYMRLIKDYVFTDGRKACLQIHTYHLFPGLSLFVLGCSGIFTQAETIY